MPDIIVPAKPKEIEIPLSITGAKALVEKHKGGDLSTDMAALAACASDITSAAAKVKTTAEAILGNQLATPIKRTAAAKSATHKIFTGVASKIDATRKRTESTIATLEASTLPPAPKDAVAAFFAGEIRAALRRMQPDERAKAVTAAIADGDDAFVAAAVLGNTALTGLGAAERDALRDAWQRRHHGATLQRIANLRASLDAFDRVSSVFQGWTLGLFAEQNAAIAAAERSERLAKEALASASAG